MKPLIVGLNNPLSFYEDEALVTYPPGCTGERILRFMQAEDPAYTEADYYADFDRTNLWRGTRLPSGPGTAAAYRACGEAVLEKCRGREDVVLLGTRVWSAVTNRTPPDWFRAVSLADIRFWFLPHPSARNLIYNQPSARERAGWALLHVVGRKP